MNKDLLYIYIKANRISFLYYLFIAFVFIYGRLSVQPEYPVILLAAGATLLAISSFFMFRQQRLYQRILRDRSLTDANIDQFMVKIALNKACYILPWLIVLFYPFQTAEFTNHILGYIFVCSAIALYASTSSASFRLFLWDAGIPALFAAAITASNYYGAATYTYYISIMLILLFAFALLIGRKINQSSVELVRKKYQLEEAMAKAAEASRAKSDFLAIMSHEVRTPMTGIMGMIGYLKDTRLTPEQKDCLETIDSCSATLLNTLNDVLDVSTIEAGKFSIEPVNFNLHKNIISVVKTVKPAAEDKSLTLLTDIDPTLPRFIYADPNRVQQALINFLNNAVKFTEAGTITVKAFYVSETKRVRVEVIDTGIGISPEDQGKLFEKFSQIKGAANRKYEGTGLGLAIAKSLVELMDGEVGVSSARGEGAVFWFEIPYVEPQASVEEEGLLEKERSFADLEILLVEDNPVNVMIVEKILGDKVKQLLVARSGKAALDLVQKGHFNLVLMDLNLPDIDGIETTGQIRALGGIYATIPIIALTANTVQENIAACYRAGMAGHLIKPYRPSDLYRVIGTYASSDGDHGGSDGATGAGQIQAMREEFGAEYTSQFINTARRNIDELFAILKKELDQSEPDYKIICQCAHDIKAVSGSLDMKDTARYSARLEKESGAGTAVSAELVASLAAAIADEIGDVLAINH